MRGIDILNIVVIAFAVSIFIVGMFYISTKDTVNGILLFFASIVTMLIACMANSALEM